MPNLERCAGCPAYQEFVKRQQQGDPNAQNPCDNCSTQKAAIQYEALRAAGKGVGPFGGRSR